MNISKIIEEQQKNFLNAKDELEAARLKKPDRQFPVKIKERTIVSLKSRVTDLVKAKEEAIQEFDVNIKALQTDISRLEKEIVDAKDLQVKENDDKPVPSVSREDRINPSLRRER